MNEQNERKPASFVVTKGFRLFAEMCDSCRRSRYVGLGYGPPGTGKTESAKYYAQWNSIKPFLPEPLITFTGRNTVDGLYPYKPLAFASAAPERLVVGPGWRAHQDRCLTFLRGRGAR